MGPRLTRVRVCLLWWGDEVGRLILVRFVDHPASSFCEMWWSLPVSDGQVAETGTLLDPVQWEQLCSGEPVPYRPLSIKLYRISSDLDDLRALSEVLRQPNVHLLFSTHTLVHRETQQPRVLAQDRMVVGTHRLASLILDVAALAGGGFDPCVQPSNAFVRLAAEAPPIKAAYDLTLSDVRGVMIGDDNHQINRFDITVRDAEFDLERVLARPEVRSAMDDVVMNPGDEGLRAAWINALAHPGWFVSWHPARLMVRDPGAMPSAGFLATLLGINVNTIVGDGRRQTNRFTYIASSLPEAQDLLAGNVELARAVAGLICPASPTTDTVSLLNIINRTVSRLPVDFVNGRQQARTLRPSPSMKITRVDGAMVGERTVQKSIVKIDGRLSAGSFERLGPNGPETGGKQRPTGPSFI